MTPRIPGPKPGGSPSLLDLLLPQLQAFIQDIPILGDLFELITGKPDADDNDFASFINGIIRGVKAGATGDTSFSSGGFSILDDLFDAVFAQHQAVETNTEDIANLNDIAAATSVTPVYVGDTDAMVTTSRGSLVWPKVTIGGTTGLGGTTTAAAHTHPSGNLAITVTPSTYTFTPAHVTGAGAVGKVYYTPIPTDRKGKVQDMSWMVGADASILSIDDYRMGLGVYNPANGNIEKVWGSANLKDSTASTTTLAEVILDMGLDQITIPGQILFVMHLQIAPGFFQACRSFAAAPWDGRGRPSSMLLDAACWVTNGNESAIPSSKNLASDLTRINSFIPYGTVSVDTSVTT